MLSHLFFCQIFNNIPVCFYNSLACFTNLCEVKNYFFKAVIEDCVDVVDVLVKSGANLNIKDADLWTPLHAAVACGNLELCKYLCENGASMVEINTDGNMPIDLVEDNEDIEIYLDGKMAASMYFLFYCYLFMLTLALFSP